jgi:hypothetical protein
VEHVLKQIAMGMGIKLFNKMPNEVRKSDAMWQFKKELKSLLLQHTFYAVHEYIVILININLLLSKLGM